MPDTISKKNTARYKVNRIKQYKNNKLQSHSPPHLHFTYFDIEQRGFLYPRSSKS